MKRSVCDASKASHSCVTSHRHGGSSIRLGIKGVSCRHCPGIPFENPETVTAASEDNHFELSDSGSRFLHPTLDSG